MKITITRCGGVQTRYYHAGAGPPVLLLHGMAVTADTWICNIDMLGAEFAVYAPDMIGRGLTDDVDLGGGPPQPREVDHLFSFADMLGLDRFSIVGGSYGGLVGALMYLAQPERIERLVIGSSGSALNTEAQQARMLSQIEKNTEYVFGPGLDFETCRQRLAKIVHDPACLPEAMLRLLATFCARPEMAAAHALHLRGMSDTAAVRPYRIIDRFDALRLPVLVLNGRQDALSSWERSLEAAAAMPDARAEIWDECGHLPQIEYPDRFNRTVRDFLSGSSSAEPPNA